MKRRWLRGLRYFGLARPVRVSTYSELALLEEHGVKRMHYLDGVQAMQAHLNAHLSLLNAYDGVRVRFPPRIYLDGWRAGAVVSLWGDWSWA